MCILLPIFTNKISNEVVLHVHPLYFDIKNVKNMSW